MPTKHTSGPETVLTAVSSAFLTHEEHILTGGISAH